VAIDPAGFSLFFYACVDCQRLDVVVVASPRICIAGPSWGQATHWLELFLHGLSTSHPGCFGGLSE